MDREYFRNDMNSSGHISRAISYLWAKKSDFGNQLSWLPLVVHLKDTMNVAGWIWNHWLTEGQRKSIVLQMDKPDEIVAEKVVRFLGGIHDIGKATPVFQIQKSYSSVNLQKELLLQLEHVGYRGISELILASPRHTPHSLAGEYILKQFGVRADIASIVGAHHGKPTDDITLCEDQEYFPANYYQSDKSSSEIYCLWENSQKEILKWVLEQSELYGVGIIPSFSMPAQVLLSGIIIMSDWIASNEAYFPLIPLGEAEVENEEKRFADGIQKWFMNLPLTFEELDCAEDTYKKRFRYLPRNFQKDIFDTIKNIDNPGIVIIEAPTGCGKTEAALVTAEQLAAKTGRGGLFFGLPTQATSNGIIPRIIDWLSSVSEDYGSTSLRLAHGKAALNPIMQQLAMSTHIAEDQGSTETILVNEWFSGRKKTSLDDIVVGTVDNFLMVSLKQKHLALRHLWFDKKVVVIDEVHAYDAYMQQYLSEAIRWMGAYNVPVVLLSATLPAEIRINLIESYLGGRGVKKRDLDRTNVDLETEQYPLLTYSDGNKILQNTSFQKEDSRAVLIKKIEETALLDTIDELVHAGGILGIIVNTVRRSQEIARLCADRFGETNVELLHASFIATDRVQKERNLLQMIGKDACRPYKKIVIGTQVIEQSLDIDFDVLITDLCPMDLLIQRIGRLHRHKISRPQAHCQPVAYIMGTSNEFEFEQGSDYIYGTYLLARTQIHLPESINVPDDVSGLVQKVYQKEDKITGEFSTETMARYDCSKEKFSQEIREKGEKAKTFRIGHPVLRIAADSNNLTGWLRDPDYSVSEEEAAAQVRDIQETIEVIAVRAYGEEYGLFNAADIKEKRISEYLDDMENGRILAGQTLRLPVFLNRLAGGTHRLINDLESYNKQYLRKWQENPWLKGSLGIVFDENQTFCIQNVVLQYDVQYGLQVNCQE